MVGSLHCCGLFRVLCGSSGVSRNKGRASSSSSVEASAPCSGDLSTSMIRRTMSTPRMAQIRPRTAKCPAYSYITPPTTGPKSSPAPSATEVIPIIRPTLFASTCDVRKAKPETQTSAADTPCRALATTAMAMCVPRKSNKVDVVIVNMPKRNSALLERTQSVRAPTITMERLSGKEEWLQQSGMKLAIGTKKRHTEDTEQHGRPELSLAKSAKI